MIARLATALLLFTIAAAVPVAVAQPTPAVELGSILDNVHIYADKGLMVFMGPDGKPIAASDVVAGPGLIAFKAGKRRNVAIGYAVFGGKIDLAPVTAE